MWSERGRNAVTVLLFLCGLSVSCNEPQITIPTPSNSDGGTTTPTIPGLMSIKVLPGNVTLTVGTTPQTQVFMATGVFDDGHMEDITQKVTWSTSPSSLGRFNTGSTLEVGPYGGEGLVFARSGSLPGTAMVSVRVSRKIVEPDANGGDEKSFAGPGDPQSPLLVYPYTQVLLPPNLGSMDVQWLRGNPQNNLFEISLQNKVTDLRVYTGCRVPMGGDPAGCTYLISQTLWSLMAYSNLGNDDPVVITVRGTGPGKTVGTSKPVNVRFSMEDLKGGIYYWTTQANVSGIYRIDLEKAKVEPYYLASDAPLDHFNHMDLQTDRCVGCHSLSHAGDKMSVVLGGGYVSDLVQLDVAKKQATLTKIDRVDTTPITQQFSNFQTYNFDGTSFVSALRGKLRLLDAAQGNALIPLIDTGGTATHPDWSRSGAYLLFSRYTDVDTNDPAGDDFELFIKQGAIGMLSWNGKGFDTPRTLVPAAPRQNSYYPSMAPNDQYAVFNRVSGCMADLSDCTAYNNARAKLYMISTSPGQKELELANINRRGPTDTTDALTNSWPKFSPFRQAAKNNQTVMWVTFSSTRNYGVRLPGNSTKPQLWMAAITVGGEPVGGDPSSAPFWIPNQDLQTHNHIAQWTEQIIPVLQ